MELHWKFHEISLSTNCICRNMLLLYSLLNKKLWRICYSKSVFFVIFSNFSSNWKSKWSAKLLHSLGSAKLLQTQGSKSIAGIFSSISRKIQFCYTFAPIISSNWRKIAELQKCFCQFDEKNSVKSRGMQTFAISFSLLVVSSYLVNSIAKRREQFRAVWGVSPKSINQKRDLKTVLNVQLWIL